MKRFMAAIAGVSLFLALWGCETAKGFGKDMQKAGGWIEKTLD